MRYQVKKIDSSEKILEGPEVIGDGGLEESQKECDKRNENIPPWDGGWIVFHD